MAGDAPYGRATRSTRVAQRSASDPALRSSAGEALRCLSRGAERMPSECLHDGFRSGVGHSSGSRRAAARAQSRAVVAERRRAVRRALRRRGGRERCRSERTPAAGGSHPGTTTSIPSRSCRDASSARLKTGRGSGRMATRRRGRARQAPAVDRPVTTAAAGRRSEKRGSCSRVQRRAEVARPPGPDSVASWEPIHGRPASSAEPTPRWRCSSHRGPGQAPEPQDHLARGRTRDATQLRSRGRSAVVRHPRVLPSASVRHRSRSEGTRRARASPQDPAPRRTTQA